MVNKGEMSRASYINYNEGIASAKSFAADHVEGGYVIDEQLSTKDALIFVKGDGNLRSGYGTPDDLVVAYRGTQGKEVVKDWSTNIERIGGIPNAADRDQTAVEQSIFEKYGRGPIDTTGHSKGGISAIQTSQRTGGKSVTFDPAYSGQQMVKGNLNTQAEHVVLRTLTDPVSLGTKLLGRNVKIINVRSSDSAAGEFRSPMDAHDLNHLTMSQYMQNLHGEESGIEMHEMTDSNTNENPLMFEETEAETITEPLLNRDPVTRPHPDRTDEFDSLYDSIPPDEMEMTTEAYHGSAAHTTATGATAFGAGLAANDMLQKAGSTNPIVNAGVSGIASGVAGEATKTVLESSTKLLSEELAMAALKGSEGGLIGLASAPVDMAINHQLRKDGMNATDAGAASGAGSVAAVSATMFAASTVLNSIAAGEMTLGPEMAPFAATTAAFAGVASAQGAALGFVEDNDRRIVEHNAEIEQEHQDSIDTFETHHSNDVQEVLSARHQQIRDMLAAEQTRKKTEQMDLRDLLEASRDHPETLSIEDAHTLTHTRAQYENGTLDDYMADIVDKHDSGFWSSDREDRPEIPPVVDYSSLAVGASADTVVTHEAG